MRRLLVAVRVQERTIRRHVPVSMLRQCGIPAIDTRPARRRETGGRSSARSPRRRRSWSAGLPAAGDELGDLLAALLSDLLEVLVTVLFGHGVAADLPDAAIEARAVELFHLLAALLADLLVEVGTVPLRRRAAALLPDLLVELRAVPLRRRGPTLTSGLRDGHRAFVLRHGSLLHDARA